MVICLCVTFNGIIILILRMFVNEALVWLALTLGENQNSHKLYSIMSSFCGWTNNVYRRAEDCNLTKHIIGTEFCTLAYLKFTTDCYLWPSMFFPDFSDVQTVFQILSELLLKYLYFSVDKFNNHMFNQQRLLNTQCICDADIQIQWYLG